MELQEGIIVKTINYKESSKIIYIITSGGLDSIEVKGANKLNGHSHIYANLLSKIAYNSSKHFFKSGKVLNNYVNIKTNISKLNSALQILELAYSLIEHITDFTIFYNFLDEILDLIDTKDNYEYYESIFFIKTLYLLGIAPSLNACVKCGKRENLLGFVFNMGGMICTDCYDQSYVLYESGTNTINNIRYLYYTKLDVLKENEKEMNFSDIRRFYQRYYFEYLGYESKSYKILSKII